MRSIMVFFIHCDITVSKPKNLENRFYVFCVDSIKNKLIRDALNSMVATFDSSRSSLVSVKYWNGMSALTNTSSLFQQFVSKFPLDDTFIHDNSFDSQLDPSLFDLSIDTDHIDSASISDSSVDASVQAAIDDLIEKLTIS